MAGLTTTMTKMAAGLPLAMLAIVINVADVQAKPVGTDEFGAMPHKTAAPLTPLKPTGPVTQGAMSMMSKRTPAVTWFETVDTTVAALQPSSYDLFVLNRDVKQEAERVQQWTNTAARVAKNYRRLAATLKTLSVPDGAEDLKEYRDARAEWYSDAAEIYEDIIKPRKAAATIEELQGQLNEIKSRAEALRNANRTMLAMDFNMRTQYHVHAAEHGDALQWYVKGK